MNDKHIVAVALFVVALFAGTLHADPAPPCDLGKSLTIDRSSGQVGDDIVLTWCDPSYFLVDSGYTVDFYRIYSSRSSTGPFTPLADVQGRANTRFVVHAAAAGSTYYYVESHGCQGAFILCGINHTDSTMLSNIVSTTVADPGSCLPNDTTLCLQNGRFKVQVVWNFDPPPPPGHPTTSFESRAVQLNDQSGYFWFFDRDNVEVTVKILNACPSGYWVFAAGMTNLPTNLIVTEMKSGRNVVYSTPGKKTAYPPFIDVSSFACN